MKGFQPGHTFAKGRPAGSKNKSAEDIRQMVIGALDELGGQEWIIEQAKNDPKTFLNLIAKILPKETNLNIGEVFLPKTIGEVLTEASELLEKQ